MQAPTTHPSFQFDGRTLRIFNAAGFLRESDRAWFMEEPDMGVMVEIEPKPASPEIEAGLNQDIANKVYDKIHQIEISPNTAIRLFLEGRIDADDLQKVEPYSDSVLFFGIKFRTTNGTRPLMVPFLVLVKRGETRAFATVDKNGKIL